MSLSLNLKRKKQNEHNNEIKYLRTFYTEYTFMKL